MSAQVPPAPIETTLVLLQEAVRDLAVKVHELTSRQDQPDSILEMAKTLAGGVVVVLAPFYAAGWTYLHQYYKAFGVSTYDISFPVYDPLIFSLSVVSAGCLAPLFTFASVVGVGIGLSSRRVKEWLPRSARIILLFMFIPILGYSLSAWGAHLAQQRALEHMKESDATFPFVAVYTEGGDDKNTKGGAPNFDSLDYKLLLHANGQYFIFLPLKQSGALQPTMGALQMFIIPEKRVCSIKVQRGIDHTLKGEQ